ncbi:MAG: hypothetical protein L6M37_00115 [Candidatus Methylarchaceae archaeon HK02M1]|nr:hypothetical protein [Candidatus Methylarchaceae archaeon HK02M1]
MTSPELEKLELEEYKLCSQLIMNESRVYWARHNFHLALSSALITVWAYFAIDITFLRILGLIGIGFIGFTISLIWWFISGRARAYSIYWMERANEIEGKIPELRLFSEERFNEFFKNRKLFEKQPITKWAMLIPLMFMFVWVGLTLWITFAQLGWMPFI